MEITVNTIYLGDCLDIMKDIPEGIIDMVLCDLPYGVTARNDWDVQLPLTELWKLYKKCVKENGAIVLTATEPYASILISSNLNMFRYDLIWNKKLSVGFLNANRMPLRQHENILVFYRKLPVYNPQKEIRGNPRIKGISTSSGKHTTNYNAFKSTSSINNEYFPTSIITIGNTNRTKSLHSTQKPVALFEWLIKTYTNEGDIVLDNCIGSGTTAIAAKQTNRYFIGIEKNPKYYQIAVEQVKEVYTKEEK